MTVDMMKREVGERSDIRLSPMQNHCSRGPKFLPPRPKTLAREAPNSSPDAQNYYPRDPKFLPLTPEILIPEAKKSPPETQNNPKFLPLTPTILTPEA